jgi:hypothetical protein
MKKTKPLYTYPCIIDGQIVEVKRYPPSWFFRPEERLTYMSFKYGGLLLSSLFYGEGDDE